MKKTITKQEQQRINQLLDSRRVKEVTKLISTPKKELTKDESICRLLQDEWDNNVSQCGMTYLEIEQFNNTYNNF
jgi:hypothetical protein